MRFDPNTCRMVDDEWHRSSPIYGTSPRGEEEHWIWKVLGIAVLVVWVGFVLAWLNNRYNIASKAKCIFSSESELITKAKLNKQEVPEPQYEWQLQQVVDQQQEQINRVSTSCCYCAGCFVVELRGAPRGFHVECPYCHRTAYYSLCQ